MAERVDMIDIERTATGAPQFEEHGAWCRPSHGKQGVARAA